MKKFFRGKTATVIIVIATIVLAGIAIFTATRLYQLRQTSVAPTAPESEPAAATIAPAPTIPVGEKFTPGETCTALTFSITGPTPTGSPSSTPTATPGPTDGPTATPGPTDGPTATPGPTDGPTATPGLTSAPITPPTSEPALPDAGIETPTIAAIGAGALLLIFALALVI